MKQYPRIITLCSGLLSFFCFSLPWVNNDSGIELVNSDGAAFISVAFVATLVIIGTSLFRLSRGIVVISSCFSLFCILPLFFHDILNLDIVNLSPVSVQFGAFLTAVGFFLAIASVLYFPKTEDSSAHDGDEKDETDHQGDEE